MKMQKPIVLLANIFFYNCVICHSSSLKLTFFPDDLPVTGGYELEIFSYIHIQLECAAICHKRQAYADKCLAFLFDSKNHTCKLLEETGSTDVLNLEGFMGKCAHLHQL